MDAKAKEILEIINSNGGEAKIVGGYVRDSLLGIETVDIDIASNLLPAECTKLFESLGYKVIPTGIDFGTVTILFDGQAFEVTTLREDLNCDGRHAKVKFSKDFFEDAKRRDFTFNALYMSADGKIHDYFDGQKDLSSGVVRFIGDASQRIKEDYLRILRMFRFHARYGKGDIIDSQIKIAAQLKSGLAKISGERIHQEIFKLFLHKNQINSVNQMVSSGILSYISGVDRSEIDISCLKTLIHLYGADDDVDPITVIALIFDIESSDDLFERWRLSKKEALKINDMLTTKKNIDLNDDYTARKNLRLKGKKIFIEHCRLMFSIGKIGKQRFDDLISQALKYKPIECPVKSDDLMNLGIEPGKKMGILLKKSEEIWEKSAYKKNKKEVLSELKLKA